MRCWCCWPRGAGTREVPPIVPLLRGLAVAAAPEAVVGLRPRAAKAARPASEKRLRPPR